MAVFEREINALNAYCRILQNSGVSTEKLRECKLTVLGLMPYLQNLSPSGLNYRGATNEFLQLLSESEKEFCISIIREYFVFWMNDVETIAVMSKGGDFESDSSAWCAEAIESICVKLDAMEAYELTAAETALVNVYEQALPKRSRDKFFVHVHLTIANFLVYKLRKLTSESPSEYRLLIDELLALFSNESEKRIFLIVARHMYYHWRNAGKSTLANDSTFLSVQNR